MGGGDPRQPHPRRWLNEQSCKYHVHTQKMELAHHRYPPDWPAHQYSLEHHLASAAPPQQRQRVTRAEADLTVVLSNFSLFCIAGKTFSRRRFWYDLIHDASIWNNSTAQQPVVVPLQAGLCGHPWADVRGSFRPRNTILLTEVKSSGVHSSLVVPFVVTRPRWLVDERVPGPSTLPWAERKLLFFAGHVPKLFQSKTRYLLWKQLRRDPRATTHSWTIQCTVGSYRACHLSDEQIGAKGRAIAAANPALLPHSNAKDGVVAFLASHCHYAGCSNTSSCDASLTRPSSAKLALKVFRRRCAPYFRHVNYTDEAADMERDAATDRARARMQNRGVQLAGSSAQTTLNADTAQVDDAYLRNVMGHRFCVVAPGDTWSTKKISETIALGGAGGCIPVLVVPSSDLASALPRFLPYTSWLDYCSIAYLVTDKAAQADFSAVAARLAAVPEREAQLKLRALNAVQDAFVIRTPTSSGRRPRLSATDFVYGVACEAAKRSRTPASSVSQGVEAGKRPPIPMPIAGGDHTRCLLA